MLCKEVSMPCKHESADARRKAVTRVLLKHPGHVPMEVVFDSMKLPRKRYLLKPDMTVGQFMAVLRDRRVVKPCDGLFMMFGTVMPPVTASMNDMHSQHQDEAGMLVCTVCRERTFGCAYYKPVVSHGFEVRCSESI